MYAPAGAKIGMMTGQTLAVGRIPLPGGAIASYGSGGLNNYAHADWLGTTRFGSTATRTKDGDWAFAPFGEVYAGSSTSYSAFTGQNSDMGSNLWDFSFREYHSTQGHWISPDPAGLAAVNPMNPQTWNRYAYVGGNPLSAVDRTGLFSDARGCSVGCGGGGVYAAPDFFTSELSAANQTIDFSFGAWADWNLRQNFGDYYYDLPGHSNPMAQALSHYVTQVNEAFGQLVADAHKRTADCIAKGLQSTFNGSTATAGASTGEVGGHWNFAVQLQFSSFATASAFTSAYASSAANGWPPPARFGSGSGPALHLENLGSWSASSGSYSIDGTAHIDLFNPNNNAAGLAGHVFVDGLWGHIVDFFGGSIDPKTCPYH